MALYLYHIPSSYGGFEEGIVKAKSQKDAYKQIFVGSGRNPNEFEDCRHDDEYWGRAPRVELTEITDSIFDKNGLKFICGN